MDCLAIESVEKFFDQKSAAEYLASKADAISNSKFVAG